MEASDYSNLMSVGIAISTLGGAWLTLRQIGRAHERSRKELTAEILHEAKEQDAINRARVESKIEGLESDLEHLKSDVGRDLKNLKELYSNDVRNIADKIENLRDELSTQHSNMLALLTRLVDKD